MKLKEQQNVELKVKLAWEKERGLTTTLRLIILPSQYFHETVQLLSEVHHTLVTKQRETKFMAARKENTCSLLEMQKLVLYTQFTLYIPLHTRQLQNQTKPRTLSLYCCIDHQLLFLDTYNLTDIQTFLRFLSPGEKFSQRNVNCTILLVTPDHHQQTKILST